MSELSVRQYLHNDGSGLTWGYDKREADKLIADLEESHKKEVGQLLIEIAELKKEKEYVIEHTADVINGQEREIQRHKYKRCLAMASKCRLRARWFGDNAFYKKEQWASQWHRRWIAIALKFKMQYKVKEDK